MARSSAGVKKHRILSGWLELAGGRVEAIDHQLVDTEIRRERMTVTTIEFYAVCVWAFLLLSGTGTLVLFDVDSRTERTAALNRQHRECAAGVVRNKH